MPEMDGYQSTRALRELEKDYQLAHIPIIALTAHAVKDHLNKCIVSGMDDVITKPFNQQQITQLLRNNPQTQYLKSMIFSPYEPFEVAGVKTRSGAPYFLINVAPTKQLGKSHQDLKKTKYFDSFSDEDKQRLNVPKK